ncbi:MAG: glycosyltransferase family 4 protein [Acidobacteriia bacterium]|jgi:UDP-glucose:(heptosyl)LPS alpha-1,3-glucosyltransferase|nr:glycosyltransferase family 4 protein [Terriglobia bacterium]
MVRPRIAVVSPFLDKRHGTERCTCEQVERLADEFEFHLYSQRVEDVDLARVVWHRIPDVPGPQLVKYLWWFLANHLWRWWDRWVRGQRCELVFSPGVNCLDADVATIHVLFTRVREALAGSDRLQQHPLRAWPRLLHRRAYYLLLSFLERCAFGNRRTQLAAVSRRTAADVAQRVRLVEIPRVIYSGVDATQFHPIRRRTLRTAARRELQLAAEEFAVLLIGNDWRNKGLPVLLEAVGRLGAEQVCVLAVGTDDPELCREVIARHRLQRRVRFLPPRPDVEFYYAAADAYAGPSLEDAFALPPAEAMACGLPVIVSSLAGVSEIVTHGEDGLILQDPRDAEELAGLLRRLLADPEFARRLGERAAQRAAQLTWEANAAALRELFHDALKPAAVS